MSKFTKYWLIIILLLAFFARFIDLGTHFLHYDDAAISIDILNSQRQDFTSKLITAVHDTNSSSYQSKPKIIVRKIQENHPFLFKTGIFLARFFIIPLNSTNAPAQFLLSALLINENQSYRTILFLSRLPSCLFSLLTLYLIFLTLRQRTNTTGLLLSMAIASLSLSAVIFAKQSYTYAIGCCASAGLLLLLQKAQEKNFFQKHWLLSGLLTAFFVYTHYQLAFLLPAYYLANLWRKRQDKNEILKLILSGAVNFLLCLPALYLMLAMNQAGLAHYYLGADKEFLFSLARNPLFFWLKNSFLAVTHILAPVAADKFAYWLLGVFFSGALIWGLRKIYRQPEGLFIILSLLTYCGLILIGQVTLSPTRQLLVYLPLFVYAIASGLPKLKEKYLAGILILYCGIFIFYFPGFIQKRYDLLQKNKIAEAIDRYQPDLIAGYEYSPQLALIPAVRQAYNYVDESSGTLLENRIPDNYQIIIFFSTRGELNKNHFQNLQQTWNNRIVRNKPWINDYADYKIVYEKIITSNIELEPNNWTTNGKNELFFYVLAQRPES